MGTLLAARSHHGDFEQYHTTFQHEGADQKCRCGARKTPVHPFTCHRLSNSQLLRYYKGKVMDLESLITTTEGEDCIAAWERLCEANII